MRPVEAASGLVSTGRRAVAGLPGTVGRVLGRDDDALPPVPLSLARAALPIKGAAGPATTLPGSEAQVVGYRVPPQRLARYREVVGSAAAVPCAFPQLLATALHLDLVSAWSFPVRAMGLVHPGFRVEVLAGIDPDQPWDLRAWIEGRRAVRSGLEFDLCAELVVGGRTCWRSTAVTLARSAVAAGEEPSRAPHIDLPTTWEHERPLEIPADTGRRFGRLSGDVNLIHLYPLTARLFGFQTPIAHGWWLLGRTAALLGVDEAVAGRQVEIAFRRPVPLPSTPVLGWAGQPGESLTCALALPGSDRPAVTARITG